MASYAQTLILNSHYRPHAVYDWKDAVTAMFNGKIAVLAQYDEILARLDRQTLLMFPDLRKSLRQVVGTDVDSIDVKVPAVAVIQAAHHTKFRRDHIKFSMMNVCLRDNFTCQYCNTQLPMSLLNKDHVIPRDQGGKTTWTNIVASCYDCNGRKANRTPEQAGMPLLSVPVKPKVLPMAEPQIHVATAPVEWHPYLKKSA